MKAYKFTKREYYEKGSFRLGTLYDYRREEMYGATIGDAREGSFDRLHSFDFQTTDALIKQLTSAQEFSWMYAKGEKTNKAERDRFVLTFTSANVLVFSATTIPDDFLFDDFDGSDCCIEIADFERFCGALIKEVSQPVEKLLIRECAYANRVAVNDSTPMPALPFLKDLRYAQQKEVRLCLQYFGDPTDPLTVSSPEALTYCRAIKDRTGR